MLALRQPCDVVGGIAQLAAIRQRDRIEEGAAPSLCQACERSIQHYYYEA